MKESQEKTIIEWWPVTIPVGFLIFLYLGIGSFLAKQLNKWMKLMIKL